MTTAAEIQALINSLPGFIPPGTHGHRVDSQTYKSIFQALLDDITTVNTQVGVKTNGFTQNNSELVYPVLTTDGFGPMDAPPLATVRPNSGLDFLPHFYNDTGLSRTPPGLIHGDIANYDSRWNFRDRAYYNQYFPDRESLLGRYKGDNPNVLDWICYWHVMFGVTGLSLVQADTGFTDDWVNPEDNYYWVRILFEQVPNFRLLKYTLWSNVFGTTTDIEHSHDLIVAQCQQYDNFYTYRENGKNYLPIFFWDMDLVRTAYDGPGTSITNSRAMLYDLADKVRDIPGVDGVMPMCQNGGIIFNQRDQAFLDHDVVLVRGRYHYVYGDQTTDYHNLYANYVNDVVFEDERDEILGISTSAVTVAPHPSFPGGLNLAGSTPALWGRLCQKAANHVLHAGKRRFITGYGMGEWTEAGTNTIPDIQNRFGYLEGIRNIALNAETITPDIGFLPFDYVPAEDLSIVSGVVEVTVASKWRAKQYRHGSSDAAASAWIVPEGWHTMDVHIHWSNDAASTGNVVWTLNIGTSANGDDLATDVITINSANAAGTQDHATDSTLTSSVDLAGAGIAAGALINLRLTRSGSSGSDTLTNSCSVLGVRLVRTS